MKRIGLCVLWGLVGLTVYGFAATNDFRVTAIVIEGNNVRITWQCTGPSSFVLQAGATVTGTTNFVGSVFISSSTLTTTNLVDPNGATNLPARFYRVKNVPPS